MDAPRRSIVERLQLGPASAAEIAAELGHPVSVVRLELRKLTRAGVVDHIGKSSRRGVSEHLYSIDLSRFHLRCGEMEDLPGHLVDASQIRILRLVYDAAMAAVKAGTFYDRDEFALIRFAIPLDDRGWKEACLLHERLLESIIEVFEKAGSRFQDGDGMEAFPACAAVILFEAPSPWPSPVTHDAQTPVATRRAPRGHRLKTLGGMGDPLRSKILDALSLEPAGVGELAERLGVPREKIRYEVDRLFEMDFVTVHSRRRRRGMEERLFVCQNRNLVVGADEIPSCDPATLDGFCRSTVPEIFRGAVGATQEGAFRDREDFVLGRIPARIDSQGFNEASTLISDALDRLFELREQCLARLSEAGEAPRAAISNLLLFERPAG